MPQLNNVGFIPGNTGTGTIDVGSRIDNSYHLPAEAGAASGETYGWRLDQGLDTQIFTGIYTDAATDTVSRANTLLSIIGGVTGAANINITGGASIRAVLVAEDLVRATIAEFRSKTANRLLTPDVVFDAAAEVALTDAANIAWNMNDGIDFTVTLGGNRTLDFPTNPKVGQRGRIRVVQDATGSRTLAYENATDKFTFADKSAIVLTTAANAEDFLYYDCYASNRILLGDRLNVGV